MREIADPPPPPGGPGRNLDIALGASYDDNQS